jgi:hypothetical protein
MPCAPVANRTMMLVASSAPVAGNSVMAAATAGGAARAAGTMW